MISAAFIPARATSRRFPGKNVAPFGPDRLPLVAHAVRVANGARALGVVGRVVVSTDSATVSGEAARGGECEPDYRADAERGPDVTVMQVLRAWLKAEPVGTRPELVCLLLPTSPLRTARHVVESRLLMVEGVDVVMSVTPFRQDVRYALTVSLADLAALVEWPGPGPYWKHDGTVIWARTSNVLAGAGFYSGNVCAYPIPSEQSADVDTPLDLAWAEFLAGGPR